MNMPPLPYLKRIRGLNTDGLHHCFTDASVWANFDPGSLTLCSPDPQAIRMPDDKINVLTVTLPTNFKAARFDSEASTNIMRQFQREIEAIRFDAGDAHDRPAGEAEGARVDLRAAGQVGDAVHRQLSLREARMRRSRSRRRCTRDIEASRRVYDWVRELCMMLGAAPDDLVPFEKYAAAANGLIRPSSAARALFDGAPNIERVDRLVQSIAAQRGMRNAELDATVALVDARLEMNRKAAA